MSWTEWRRRLARQSEPTPEQLGRVKSRLDAQLHSTASLLANGGEPTPFQLARVRARLQPSAVPARPLFRPALAVPLLAAALALVAVGSGRFFATPEQPTTVALAGTSGALALSNLVEVTPAGDGTANGTGREWKVDWRSGSIDVAVVPKAGAQVEIDTVDATVRVIGTKFTVERDALGTRVAVRDGKVAVECRDGSSSAELVAGRGVECLPATRAGLLARAIAQSKRQDPPAAILATIDRGLDRQADGASDADALRGELLANRLEPLLALGMTSEARQTADEYLALPNGPRAVDVHRIAARLAIAAGDCASALPHLEALPALADDEAAWADRCRTR
jgi:hypothetical protein